MTATLNRTEINRDSGASDGAAPLGGRQKETVLNNRQRFLNACQCRAVDRPPVWLMRQAGARSRNTEN
jgi:hypothetical protein